MNKINDLLDIIFNNFYMSISFLVLIIILAIGLLCFFIFLSEFIYKKITNKMNTPYFSKSMFMFASSVFLVLLVITLGNINIICAIIFSTILEFMLIAVYCIITQFSSEMNLKSIKNSIQLFFYTFIPFLAVYATSYIAVYTISDDLIRITGQDIIFKYFESIHNAVSLGVVVNLISSYNSNNKKLKISKINHRNFDSNLSNKNYDTYLNLEQSSKFLVYKLKKIINKDLEFEIDDSTEKKYNVFLDLKCDDQILIYQLEKEIKK